MASSEGTSLLETPLWIIFVFFAFFSIYFSLHRQLWYQLIKALQRRGKHGLLAAAEQMKDEAALLGIITLLLSVFEGPITGSCVRASLYKTSWLDAVNGCACCLTHTGGVSPCFLSNRDCGLSDQLAECCAQHSVDQECPVRTPAAEVAVPAPDSKVAYEVPSGKDTEPTVGLATEAGSAEKDELVRCVGRVEVGWEQCDSPDQIPFISATALHDIHIFIFVIGASHILTCCAVFLLASFQMHPWKRWTEHVEEDALATRIKAAIEKKLQQQSQADAEGSASGDAEESGSQSGSQKPKLHKTLSRSLTRARFTEHLAEEFSGRPPHLSGVGGYLLEAAICIVHPLTFWPVSHLHFRLMRGSFYYTHSIGSSHDFDFIAYLRDSLEDDYAQLVGLSVPVWLIIVLSLLLSWALGWSIWLFTIVAGVLLLAVNTKLMWNNRFVTRGGVIHTLTPEIFWLNRPWLMLFLIKGLIFAVSFVFASEIFFAARYGSSSCFFAQSGFQNLPSHIPWWALIVVNFCYLVSLSLYTVPLYSLLVHMGGDFKGFLVPVLPVPPNPVEDRRNRFRRYLSAHIPRQRDLNRDSTGSSAYNQISPVRPMGLGTLSRPSAQPGNDLRAPSAPEMQPAVSAGTHPAPHRVTFDDHEATVLHAEKREPSFKLPPHTAANSHHPFADAARESHATLQACDDQNCIDGDQHVAPLDSSSFGAEEDVGTNSLRSLSEQICSAHTIDMDHSDHAIELEHHHDPPVSVFAFPDQTAAATSAPMKHEACSNKID